MKYASEFTPIFLRLLHRLDKKIKERALRAAAEVLDDPYKGSQLIFAKETLFKWRIGDYRMIYKVDEKRRVVTFIIVEHRSKVYGRLQ